MRHLWRGPIEPLHLRTVCSEVGRVNHLPANSLLPLVISYQWKFAPSCFIPTSGALWAAVYGVAQSDTTEMT